MSTRMLLLHFVSNFDVFLNEAYAGVTTKQLISNINYICKQSINRGNEISNPRKILVTIHELKFEDSWAFESYNKQASHSNTYKHIFVLCKFAIS